MPIQDTPHQLYGHTMHTAYALFIHVLLCIYILEYAVHVIRIGIVKLIQIAYIIQNFILNSAKIKITCISFIYIYMMPGA